MASRVGRDPVAGGDLCGRGARDVAVAAGRAHDDGVRILLAAIQCEKGAVAANQARHRQLLGAAAAAGCDLALFPEMSLTGSVDPAAHPDRLMSLQDPAVGELAQAAGDAGVAACFGLAERAPGGTAYITQVVAAAGRVTGLQRKRHPGDGEEAFTPAAEPAVLEHAGVRFAIAICARRAMTRPSTRPRRRAPGWCCSRPRRGCTDGGPALRPGGTGSRGGRAAAWATPGGTRAAGDCGSRWPGRPGRPPARTSPAWPPWSARPAR
jgi:hypothetical protein